jgi:hypothetical protein
LPNSVEIKAILHFRVIESLTKLLPAVKFIMGDGWVLVSIACRLNFNHDF